MKKIYHKSKYGGNPSWALMDKNGIIIKTEDNKHLSPDGGFVYEIEVDRERLEVGKALFIKIWKVIGLDKKILDFSGDIGDIVKKIEDIPEKQ